MRSAFVSIIGRSNVGKSTILNAILKEKIAIAVNKPQTTRNNIRGVYTEDDIQIVFIDTPGIHKTKNLLSKKMVSLSNEAREEGDVILFVVDSPLIRGGQDEKLIENIKRSDKPKILLINKIDKFKGDDLKETFAYYENLKVFDEVLTSRADKKLGVDEIILTLKKYLKEEDLGFDKEVKTDQSNYFYIAEIIREKALLLLKEELPHTLFVEVMKIEDTKKLIRIEANIVIEKKLHKKIIIGKSGEMLKNIGMKARKELEEIYAKKVFLELFVKTEDKWRNNDKTVSNVIKNK